MEIVACFEWFLVVCSADILELVHPATHGRNLKVGPVTKWCKHNILTVYANQL